jgi:hypothetical protein
MGKGRNSNGLRAGANTLLGRKYTVLDEPLAETQNKVRQKGENIPGCRFLFFLFESISVRSGCGTLLEYAP